MANVHDEAHNRRADHKYFMGDKENTKKIIAEHFKDKLEEIMKEIRKGTEEERESKIVPDFSQKFL